MLVGVIGCGWAGNVHIENFNRVQGTQVIAVADPDENAAKQLAEKFGIGKVYGGWKELVELDALDVVSVCSPPSTHEEIVEEAAKRGKHILVEKPMAMTEKECKNMIKAANKNKVVLSICQNKRLNQGVQEARTAIEQAGSPARLVRAMHYAAPRNPTHWTTTVKEGGMLWEEGAHQAYIMLELMGDVERVRALGKKLVFPDYDSITVEVEAKNKSSLGVMEMLWCDPPGEFRDAVEVVMPNGVLRSIDLSYMPEFSFNLHANKIRDSVKELGRIISKKVRRRQQNTRPFQSYHFELIEGFMKSIDDGTTPPIPSSEGLKTIKILEAIRKSLDKDKTVDV
ncbi:Gfo/Idh/MocA family protein [Candidatus Altiarchaeota archaeon]